jgi:hypothetical protein
VKVAARKRSRSLDLSVSSKQQRSSCKYSQYNSTCGGRNSIQSVSLLELLSTHETHLVSKRGIKTVVVSILLKEKVEI